MYRKKLLKILSFITYFIVIGISKEFSFLHDYWAEHLHAFISNTNKKRNEAHKNTGKLNNAFTLV